MTDSKDPAGRTQVVLRMLKGEAAVDLAAETGLAVELLESWRSEFLAAGEQALTGATATAGAEAVSEDEAEADAPPGDFSETSWFMAAVDIETLDEIPEEVDVEQAEYAPREDVTTDVRRTYSLRDESEIKSKSQRDESEIKSKDD